MPITPTLSNIDALLAFLLPLVVGLAVVLTVRNRPVGRTEKSELPDTGSACRGSH